MELKKQIKNAIQNLHDKGKGDYETLLRQVQTAHRKIELNEFQVYSMISQSKYLVIVVGRGGGKTTGIGERSSRILETMPRSTGLLILPSYQAGLTRIIPSLKHGLEMFGFYENLHYFVGRQPPRAWRKSWQSAYESPNEWGRYITFWNGTGIHLISHEKPNDGKGLNTDWVFGDEAALLDPAKIQENTDPTVRGTNTRAFAGNPLFGSRYYSSSMPLTPRGRWLLEYEEMARQNPKKYNYLDFPTSVNIHNLMPGYLEDAMETAMYPWMFDAEYMNIKPKFTKDGFYPLLDEDVHSYDAFDYGYYHQAGVEIDCRGDGDLVKGQPLIVGVDWGATINCLVANQHLNKEFRALKSMYVLGDLKEVQHDLFNKFHKYYRHHQSTNPTIFLWYDNMGNQATGITKRTRAEQARDQLNKLGWKVRLMTLGGRNPEHGKKHILWNNILAGNNDRLPIFRMNRSNCSDLWISMFNAKAKQGSNDAVKKDKSSESSSVILRQHATDLSDAMDAAMYGVFSRLLRSLGAGGALPDAHISGN